MFSPVPAARARRPALVCFAALVVFAVAGAADHADAARAAPAELPQRIRELREGLRDVPLPVIIEALAGHRVLPWNGEERTALELVAREVRTTINRDGFTAPRVNEAGNAIEQFVLAALAQHGFRPGRPAGPSGRAHAAGYPDLEAARGGRDFYIEVKSYSAATEDSTQRTFYLSPSADFKVTRDAHHLLIAVELERVGPDRYRATSVRWLDLSRLHCDLKHEFNASNRDLYAPSAGLVVIEAGGPVSP